MNPGRLTVFHHLLGSIALITLVASTASAAPQLLGSNGGHDYYVTQNTWLGARAEAAALQASLGQRAYLVSINSGSEEGWILSHIGYDRMHIGLSDAGHEGLYTWESGESPAYFNWACHEAGWCEPNDCVYFYPPGQCPTEYRGQNYCVMNWTAPFLNGWDDAVGDEILVSIIEVECVPPPCPSISFNVVGGVQGLSFGHLTVTLCNAFGARTSFSLWSENNGFLTKLGDPTSWSRSVVGEGDPNLWDSRITYGLTEEQYGQAALLAAEHNRQYREHTLPRYLALADPLSVFTTNCAKFAMDYANLLNLPLATHARTPLGFYDPRVLNASLAAAGNSTCFAGGGYVELNNPASSQSRRATGANSANGVPPGPWDFPPTQLTEWLQQDPGEVATILSYPLIDHGASPLKLCGKGGTITLQLTGPNREACFASLKWHSGLESPNDTTVFNHSVSITSGADESISLVLATLGAVHKYTFPVTVVTGAPDLLISVRVPLDSLIVSANGPFVPVDIEGQLAVPTEKVPSSTFTADLRIISANPTRDAARFRYFTNRAGHVEVRVHDLMGRVIARQVDEHRVAGEQVGAWDGRLANGEQAPAGIYFVSVALDKVVLGTAKLVVVR